jgi:hypothetical protein
MFCKSPARLRFRRSLFKAGRQMRSGWQGDFAPSDTLSRGFSDSHLLQIFNGRVGEQIGLQGLEASKSQADTDLDDSTQRGGRGLPMLLRIGPG